VAFSHEVLYLLDDLPAHAAAIFRVLKPDEVYYAVTVAGVDPRCGFRGAG
jgi:hypothetical protein